MSYFFLAEAAALLAINTGFKETTLQSLDEKRPETQSPATYDPARLLDALREKLKLDNDAKLAKALAIPPSSVSRMRHRKIPVYPAILIRMHEESGYSIRELQKLVGDRRRKSRCGPAYSRKAISATDKPD